MDRLSLVGALAIFLLSVAFFFPLTSLIRPVEAQHVSLVGDTGKVSVAVQCCPDTDKFGLPSINPDGTFYPNDKFWINYDAYIDGDVNFESVNVVYDSSAFEKLEDYDWGSTSGQALFKVREDARPGIYIFTIRAAGTKSYNTSSGTVTVTYGGVTVDAYYRAVYDVSVSESVKENPEEPEGTSEGTSGGTEALEGTVGLAAGVLASKSMAASASKAGPKLVIENLKWKTWLDLFKGTVCQATGYLRDSSGGTVAFSEVVVEFLKKNFWTGATWVASKTVTTNSKGYFTAEDTCNPFIECLLGVQAWAEKPGYLPSWSLTLSTNPSSASVSQESAFLVGARVYLNGRYTPVPVALTVDGLPLGCTATFHPETGQVDWSYFMQSVIMLKADPAAPIGNYTLTFKASSGTASAEAEFDLKVVEIAKVPSTARFSAHGLSGDANGTVLVVDGNLTFEAGQLPYTAYWYTHTRHSYSWSGYVESTFYEEHTYEEERVVDNETVTIVKTVTITKHYELESVSAVEHYVGIATVEVEVVKYDPVFTVVLSYTVPSSPGNNSYEKPFAIIVRYDGNGPEKRLGQRAVIEDWSWSGRASRISAQQQLTGLTGMLDVSNISPEELEKFMSQFSIERGVTFTVSGIDSKTDGAVLTVDGDALNVEDLPKTYNWTVNSTHSYKWSARMPAYVWAESPRWGTGHYELTDDEWFSFEYSLIAPSMDLDQIKVGDMTPEQIERVREQIESGFMEKATSPSGNVKVRDGGCRVTGIYAHNKLLSSIASEAGAPQDALSCLKPGYPVLFNNESRYVKFVFDLNDDVAGEALRQLFNSSISYEINFMSSAFSKDPHVFTVDFTCPFEYYQKLVEVQAVKWDPAGKGWTVDRTVRAEAFFNTAFNFTEEDWFKAYFEEHAVDEVALKMACEDVYECLPQYYGGLGAACGVMNRTSPYLYNLNITAGRGKPYVGVEPGDRDAWTESLKTYRTAWTSPSCQLFTDCGRKVAGSASIKVEGVEVTEAFAMLTLVKPVDVSAEGEPSMWGKLFFNIYLGQGCSGNLTVILQTPSGQTSMSRALPVGGWQTVSFPAAGRILRVGIYCELTEESGAFWVDGLYFTKALLWSWTESKNLERTVYVNFAAEKPYTLYVNMDPLSPLNVNVTKDDVKSSRLLVDAVPQLGGLQTLKVYAVVNAPPGQSLEDMPVENLQLRWLYTANLTAPEQRIEEEAFSGYMGYPVIHGGSALGFIGQAEILINKDSEMKALQGYNSTLLLVEAENVWGTKFHTVVKVQPYGKYYWEILIDEVAKYILYIVIAAILISLIVYILKGRQPKPFWRY